MNVQIKKAIKVLLADDHPLVQDGIRIRLESVDDITVIDVASNGVELIEKAAELQPDVVIADISMPQINGLKATSDIRAKFPNIKILILTMHDNNEYIRFALKAGANGYILKDISATEMIAAVRTVYAGKQYLCCRAKTLATKKTLLERLTSREGSVLKYLLDGSSNKDIAEKLFISVRTVECHRRHIYTKLEVNTLAGLFKHVEKSDLVK